MFSVTYSIIEPLFHASWPGKCMDVRFGFGHCKSLNLTNPSAFVHDLLWKSLTILCVWECDFMSWTSPGL
jgi:hypothetical protein